jgi:hypothetical protein
MSSGLTCFIVAMGFPSQQADAIRSGYSNSANHTPLSYRGGILLAVARQANNFCSRHHSEMG